MSKYKITKKHFELYKQEVMFWIEYYGLHGFEVHFFHDGDNMRPGDMASVYYDIVARYTNFKLNKTWELEVNNHEIKKCAFHETTELFLARMVVIGNTLYCSSDEIGEAAHAVIRTLENRLFPLRKEIKRMIKNGNGKVT